MLIIGIILAFVALAYFCWLLFALTVYAVPFFAGLSVGLAAYHSGSDRSERPSLEWSSGPLRSCSLNSPSRRCRRLSYASWSHCSLKRRQRSVLSSPTRPCIR